MIGSSALSHIKPPDASTIAAPELVALRSQVEAITTHWLQGSDRQTPGQATAKLTLRLPQAHVDALMVNAGALGAQKAVTANA